MKSRWLHRPSWSITCQVLSSKSRNEPKPAEPTGLRVNTHNKGIIGRYVKGFFEKYFMGIFGRYTYSELKTRASAVRTPSTPVAEAYLNNVHAASMGGYPGLRLVVCFFWASWLSASGCSCLRQRRRFHVSLTENPQQKFLWPETWNLTSLTASYSEG